MAIADRSELCRRWFLPFGVAALAILTYLPALRHGFVMDDAWLVVQNPYIQSWRRLPEMLADDVWNIWDRHNYWRPVFTLSLAIDHTLWGLDPWGFHLTNIALHAANVTLMFGLTRRLVGPAGGLLAALFFGLHPIQAHAVNVVSVRADLLAALFMLLSLHAFLSRRTTLSTSALGLGLLCKETAVFFPAVLVLASLLIRRRLRDSSLLLALAAFGAYFAIRISLGFSFSVPPSIFSYDATTIERVYLVGKVLALYFLGLGNLFAPPRPFWSVEVPTSIADPYVLLGLALALVLAAGIWTSRNGAPPISLGLGWFAIFFAPISNLKQLNQPMAEHWLYVPLIGLSLALGAALCLLKARRRQRDVVWLGVRAGAALFYVFAALVAREKSYTYHNDKAFLKAAVEANPGVAKLHSLLGSLYLREGDDLRAIQLYLEALRRDPDEFLANYRMGFILYHAGEREQAKAYLQKVVRSDPAALYGIIPVADAWEMLGDKEKALIYYRRALALDPGSTRLKEKVARLQRSRSPESNP